MQTKVRIFYDNTQVCAVVIPDNDKELNLHHGVLIGSAHSYVDMKNEDYLEYVIENGLPNIQRLHPIVMKK